GSCVNLGMLAESGFVARSAAMTDYLNSAGWRPLSNEQALGAVRMALASESATLTFAAADWKALTQGEQALAGSARLAPLVTDAGAGGAEGLTRLPPSARKTAALTAIRNEVAAVLRLDAAKIAAGDLLGDLGLDSLSSFELWHRIEAALAMPVPLARFTEAPSVEALAELACAIAAESDAPANEDMVTLQTAASG
ncbi:MAG TPA: phosphopantetheine-binding protein, partial [Pseudolabrys sp.]|nr:phosphopantetheine-binding protein [Pseudolabrys sp.]